MTCFYELNISEFVKYIKLNFVIHDINKKLKSILQWIGSNQSEISDHASQNTLESALSHQTIHSRLNSYFLRYSEILKFSKIFSFSLVVQTASASCGTMSDSQDPFEVEHVPEPRARSASFGGSGAVFEPDILASQRRHGLNFIFQNYFTIKKQYIIKKQFK